MQTNMPKLRNYLKNLNSISENEEISNRFQLAILNAKTAQMLQQKRNF